MRFFKFMFVSILMLGICFCLASCAVSVKKDVSAKGSISLVSWNVQTFFDGEKDGCEYDEFKKAGNWNREKYSVRLERLCNSIAAMDADIFVLIELENESVLQDISNCFAGGSWKTKDFWKYSCFAKPEDSGIGIGILSRLELSDFTTHALDIRTQRSEEPSLRYLLEVTVDCGEKDFVLFANHWKSMSGGEAETEIWRDWQESVLACRIAELNNGGALPPVVICGDFNRDVSKFALTEGGVLLRGAGVVETWDTGTGAGAENVVKVYSPWLTENGAYSTDIGSYYFKEKWERIDNIFVSDNINLTYFEPVARSPWATEDKFPFEYKLYSGEGYSDHLPLMCRFTLK